MISKRSAYFFILALSAAPLHAHAGGDEGSGVWGCYVDGGASVFHALTDNIFTGAQIATAAAVQDDDHDSAGQVAMPSDDELNNLYDRADHFDALAKQDPDSPMADDLTKASSEIRAAQASQKEGDQAGFKFHIKNIASIFGNSWKFLLQPGPLMALGAGAVGYTAAHAELNPTTTAYYNNPAHKWTGLGYKAGDYIGQGLLVVPWIAVAAITGNKKMADVTDQLLAGALTNQILTDGLKYAVNQKRPYGGSYGFPSGHTSFSFMMATVLAENYGWKAAVPAYAVAAFVGFSRVAGDMHTPAQVFAGAGLGTAVGLATTKADKFRFNLGVGPVGGSDEAPMAGEPAPWSNHSVTGIRFQKSF